MHERLCIRNTSLLGIFLGPRRSPARGVSLVRPIGRSRARRSGQRLSFPGRIAPLTPGGLRVDQRLRGRRDGWSRTRWPYELSMQQRHRPSASRGSSWLPGTDTKVLASTWAVSPNDAGGQGLETCRLRSARYVGGNAPVIARGQNLFRGPRTRRGGTDSHPGVRDRAFGGQAR
jgi:hypothetical protein